MSQYAEIASFISEHVKKVSDKDHKGGKDKDGKEKASRGKIITHRVNQEPYLKFLGERGITKETVIQLADAQAEYTNGTIEYLRDQMVATPDAHQIIINTSTPTGTMSTQITRHYSTKNPGTGDVVEKYGDINVGISVKSRLDPELLADCAAAIQATMEK